MRRTVVALYAMLVAGNLAAWAWAAASFHAYPVLLGTAFLAYGFGLRHAVDADHIAAIDSVTRTLMQRGRRPVAVGFWFSLGHSTVVILASVAVAAAAGTIERRFPAFRALGGTVGTMVSALFLFAVAALNLVVLKAVWRAFCNVRRGGRMAADALDPLLAQRGLLGRLFRPLFRLIGASWHMYPLGFLFGLGFDTASEIALLGIAAAGAAKGMAIWSILIFPALFTAGMALVDTTDSVLMVGAYGWAFVKPMRKLYYNLVITLVSVLVAVVVGGIEALGLVADRLGLDGGVWRVIAALNGNFGGLGYVIIAIFVLAWLVSALIYRFRGFDEVEAEEG
ncbi:MAG TPA: HoxN/HupN/NixA family nickel/cobalt transporter [Stellaceae bacterium]|nr:HoxN/HupN/NixA family nickel/cobalt transporter [Stellaceae bacterium]